MVGRPSPKKGIPLPEGAKQKMSEAHKIKISIEGTVFNSLVEASKYYNVSLPTIRYWSKNKKHNASQIKGIHLSEDVRKKMSLDSKRRIKISIEGTVFGSITEASKYYNVSRTAIKYWIQNKKHNAFHIEK